MHASNRLIEELWRVSRTASTSDLSTVVRGIGDIPASLAEDTGPVFHRMLKA